jgi:hypothetical protein
VGLVRKRRRTLNSDVRMFVLLLDGLKDHNSSTKATCFSRYAAECRDFDNLHLKKRIACVAENQHC